MTSNHTGGKHQTSTSGHLPTFGVHPKPPVAVILLGIADTDHDDKFMQLSLSINGTHCYGGNIRIEQDTIHENITKSAREMAKHVRNAGGTTHLKIKNGLTDCLGHHDKIRKCGLCDIPLLAYFADNFRKFLSDSNLCDGAPPRTVTVA